MDNLPADLVPLPTAPYDERPSSLPLDVEECRTALWMARGNISEAARIIKVPASRLRLFVNKSEYLRREADEAREQLVDKAESNVYEALHDEDPIRRDSMTKFVLQNLSNDRGWGNKNSGVNIKIPGDGKQGRLMVAWDDGSTFGNVIDHEAE